MDCTLPGTSVHGILQARILEWVAISFSSDGPDPRIEPMSATLQVDSVPTEPPETSCRAIVRDIYHLLLLLLSRFSRV